MSAPIQPGLLVLHGNRTELLGDAVFEWLRRQPLDPLEEDVFLVQSNGVAEWLKMTLATHSGVCAATRVELPGRFLWRVYRQVLGRGAVPFQSPLDKTVLTWRLMQLLPSLLPQPVFSPLAHFLRGGDMGRRLQLARQVADLYDQYQVYRGDWLAAWGNDFDVLPRSVGEPLALAPALAAGDRWQAALWRELLLPLDEMSRASTRPALHQRFLAALQSGSAPAAPLARRVVLFGMAHLPLQTLEALAALSAHCQVLLAIPNPCRYHWADTIDGRELLFSTRRRHPLRNDRDLSATALEDMHAHAHPLLAAWGRQSRDFVRQLDAFDDARLARETFALPKIDLFDDGPGDSLLQQVQAHVRDLTPLVDHPAVSAHPADRSIVFHIAHSAQREVEILHDQLLELLAHPPCELSSQPLHPRDIVVMVPDIAVFEPAIRSVFGQHPRGDARAIPFDIADLTERGNNPLINAIEWLLRLPQQRCRSSEVLALLDVPAVAARFDLSADDLPLLARWIEDAAIRWGLNTAQRSQLGLAECGEPNTWLFGLRRMLLGYAVGAGTPLADERVDLAGRSFFDIEPCTEIGGLEAALAGSLADLVAALLRWWAQASTPATPRQWAERARSLIDDFFLSTNERERMTVAALQAALVAWLEACDAADFDEPVALAVVREAWLSGVDEPALGRRFRAGGVTFCTLLPLRSVPFEVVCLLGMNDGDFPRPASRADFDLMGLAGQQRPGDRSRRDDDRQLMLEALLSARRVLYVSWTGRSVRDNSEQPPSVLVSQLRDYLAAGWQAESLPSGPSAVLSQRTTEHPLQPFSRRYFDADAGADVSAGAKTEANALRNASFRGPALFTHAREWRAAHAPQGVALDSAALPPSLTSAADSGVAAPLSVATLAAFLKNPVKEFFRRRLAVVFADDDDALDDSEPFDFDGLQEYGLFRQAMDEILGRLDHGHPEAHHDLNGRADVNAHAGSDSSAERLSRAVDQHLAQLRRAGQLPMAALGERKAIELADALKPLLARWCAASARLPLKAPKVPLRFEHPIDHPTPPRVLVLDDWLDNLRSGNDAERTVLEGIPNRLSDKVGKKLTRPDLLITAWVRSLAASACGVPAHGVIVARDITVRVRPLPRGEAIAALEALMAAWDDGMTVPLPLACNTAIAMAGQPGDGVWAGQPDAAAEAYEGGYLKRGDAEEPCLARLFPDFESLSADGRFAAAAEQLFVPFARWVAEQVSVEPAASAATAVTAAAAAAGSAGSGEGGSGEGSPVALVSEEGK